jgi:hypothetical protein
LVARIAVIPAEAGAQKWEFSSMIPGLLFSFIFPARGTSVKQVVEDIVSLDDNFISLPIEFVSVSVPSSGKRAYPGASRL